MNYIGSKLSLINFIDDTISNKINMDYDKSSLIFCDIFSGTGVVAKHFKEKGFSIIANDLQYYSFVRINHLIKNNEVLQFKKLPFNPIDYLNNLPGEKGFIYKNYSKTGTLDNQYTRLYFTDENAMKIDSARMQIELWYQDNLINLNEYYFLISSLIESADKVANTASVYEAFLKKIKSSASKELVITPLEYVINHNGANYEVYNEDSNILINSIKGDVLYLDPPYNTRRYHTNYHMLETIALYDNPEIKGKTGLRVDDSKKSDFSLKRKAALALEDLIEKADFKYIFLSYNNEGIITFDDIEKIFKKYGEYSVVSTEYKRFKSDKDDRRNIKKGGVVEHIHYLKKWEK